MWIAIYVAIMRGVTANIARTASVLACQELEGYRVGAAGIIGNILSVAYIPLSAMFAYLLFSQALTFLEMLGCALIGIDGIFITVVRVIRQICKENPSVNAKTESDDIDLSSESLLKSIK